MGRGVDDRGLSYISITVGRESADTDVVRRLEEALGFTFVLNNSLLLFQDKITQSLASARSTSNGKQLELVFTRLRWRSWRDTRSDPGHDILVQSRAQKAQRDQWDKEDAHEAALKKQRATDYAARMDAQQKDDEAKGIIRDGNGNVLLNLYEIRHRGSDFASKLDASFEVYGRSGFDEQYLRQVIFDYDGVLNSYLMDLGEFNKFLMSESASRLGRFVTWTGGIRRPNLTKAIESYDWIRASAISQYKSGVAPHLVLERMALVESYCGYASGELEKFYNESVSQANRIALALQIVQMAIPIGGSAAFVEMLCIQAASNFSYTITNKIVNGSDQSWAAALTDAAVGSVRDTILRTAVSKLVGKIPKINTAGGIPGEAIKVAVQTLTFQVAESMASFFKGATFGEALASLYRNLKSPEVWVGALVNHAANAGFGKYLDVPQPAAPPAKELPEGSGTRIQPQKRPVKAYTKPATAVTVALMFGSAGHGVVEPAAGKPPITETQKASSAKEGKPPVAVERPAYLDPGTKDKGLGSGTSATDKKSQKTDPLDRNTSNATAGPAKPVNPDVAADQGGSGQGPKTPTKTPKTPLAPPQTQRARSRWPKKYR